MQKLKITTDQNVPIEIDLSSIGVRLVATGIDIIISLFYFFVMFVGILSSFFVGNNVFDYESYDMWMFLLVFFVLLPVVLYKPLTETLFKGQTLGKMMLGIRVVKVNGENAKFKDYFTRWLFCPYSLYLLALGVGGIFAFMASLFFDTLAASISNKTQRIGDFMANTVVIKNKPEESLSVRDVTENRIPENFVPTYPSVTIYTDEDMMFVKEVIYRVEKYKNKASKDVAIELATRMATEMGLPEVPEKRFQFLKTSLYDYVHLTR